MSDQVEVTSTSWFSRLGSAIKGVFAGMALVLVAIILLWWNEGRSVREYKKISFAKEHTVETPYDSIDASKEGQLVHFAGKASTTDVLSEPTFGVTVKDSYKMSGSVEVYQWIEEVIPGETKEEKQLGGSVKKTKAPDTYKYSKGWKNSIVDSNSFHEKVDKQTGEVRTNPYTSMPFKEVTETIKASNVKVGAHDFSHEKAKTYIGSLGSSKPVELVADQLKLPANAIVDKNVIYLNLGQQTVATPTAPAAQTAAAAETASATVENAAAPQTTAAVTVSNTVDVNNFKLGDIRVSFTHSPVDVVTVIAKQVGSSFQEYEIDKELNPYIDVRSGDKELTKEEVFAKNEADESMMVWFLRILGFIIMSSAFGMIFKPISVLADVVPLFGDIAESGIGIISGLIAFVLSMLIIALAWLWYRPLIGILLLVLMGAAIFGIITLLAKARAAKKAAAPAAPAPEATPVA